MAAPLPGALHDRFRDPFHDQPTVADGLSVAAPATPASAVYAPTPAQAHAPTVVNLPLAADPPLAADLPLAAGPPSTCLLYTS
ncbi:resuscitation-promoting factor, partial [Streptomyces sp. WAC04770]